MDEMFSRATAATKDSSDVFEEKGQVDLELHIYKQKPNASTLTDPLKWWHSSEVQLPNLARLARIIFSGKPTSVPSERVFSTAGELISNKRSRLNEDHVDQLIFLNKNLK